MIRICTYVAAVALAAAGEMAFAGSTNSDCNTSNVQEAQLDNVTGQILIRFEDSMTEADATQIIARVGAHEIDRMMSGKIYLVEIPYPSSQNEIIDALSATKGVVYAEPNMEVRMPEPPKGSEPDVRQNELIPLPKVD